MEDILCFGPHILLFADVILFKAVERRYPIYLSPSLLLIGRACVFISLVGLLMQSLIGASEQEYPSLCIQPKAMFAWDCLINIGRVQNYEVIGYDETAGGDKT